MNSWLLITLNARKRYNIVFFTSYNC